MAETRRIVSSSYGQPFGNIAESDPDKGFTKWREPTSTGKGKVRYRKRDKQEGVDYLYDRTESIVPLMQSGFAGIQTQRRDTSIAGQPGELLFTRQVEYTNKTLAPGQSPRGARQPEQAKRASLARTGGGQAGGQAAATRRSKAGQRGTILSSASKTGGSGKTLLGG